MGVLGSVATPGLRHGQDHCRRKGAFCSSRAAESVYQDPWYQGGSACHRRIDLCRRAHKCDPLVLSRAIPCGAEAFLRGIERRIDAGLNPVVGSVASVFISRWDVAIADKVPESLHNQLGIAIANRTYKACRNLLSSPRWQRAYNAGVRPQRLLWASTGTKDPSASDILYVKALAAPFTVNTIPEGTLKALANHGELNTIMPADGGNCEEVIAEFAKAGIDVDALAIQLQEEGAKAFVNSWNELLTVIDSKSATLTKV